CLCSCMCRYVHVVYCSRRPPRSRACVLFFSAAPTTEIYPLSLHDALPISGPPAAARRPSPGPSVAPVRRRACGRSSGRSPACSRSEEHTSELQSHLNLVCRLLLEKKKKVITDRKDSKTASASVLCRILRRI